MIQAALSARIVLFVLIPAVAGWITIFQLRGWGQIHEAGALGWIVVALGGVVLGALAARALSRLGDISSRLWTVFALGAFLAGVGCGSAAFDRFASLGGLRLSVDTSTGTVALGVPVAVDIHLRNTSHQDYANVVMKGPFLHDCLPLDGDGFDVGMVAAGQDRQWSCTPPAGSELDHTFLFATGDATNERLVASHGDAALVDIDLIGFSSTLDGPRRQTQTVRKSSW